MGTTNSKQSDTEFDYTRLFNKIDQIATQYILTMDFASLQRLNEKEYCNKLVLITSEIFHKKMSSMEVKYMLQRTQYGMQTDTTLLNEMKKEKFYYFMGDTNSIQKQNVTLDNTELKSDEKTRVCIGIARFYIMIAHIFASIVKTLNPVYSYKDDDGNTIELDFFNKHKLPADKKVTIKRVNFCEKRLTSLMNTIGTDESSELYFFPKNCNVNVDKGDLSDEPGIFEFQQLYFDENYDYFTGQFTSMSASSNVIYRNDLKQIYTTFTGKSEMPENIQKFSDIKVGEFNISDCLNEDEITETNEYRIYKSDSNTELFVEYARNIKQMIQITKSNQSKLLEVLDLLFIPSETGTITLNPQLSEEMVSEIVIKTRNIILNVYTECEKHYMTGLQIYNRIVQNINKVNVVSQSTELGNKLYQFAQIEIQKWKGT